MIKKNIIKRKKKTIRVSQILIIIIITLMCFSVGYSYYSTQLSVIGNVKFSNTAEKPTELSNSTLEVKVGTTWESSGKYYYNLNMTLTNLDEDVEGWTITIDLPPYIDVESSSFWCAAEVTVEEFSSYHRVSFKNYDWNANVKLDDELVFGFNIAFNQNVEINMENVVFNGKIIEDIIYKYS